MVIVEIIPKLSKEFETKMCLRVLSWRRDRDFEEINKVVIKTMIEVHEVKHLLILLLPFYFFNEQFLAVKFIVEL